jgi:hypothetical protein
MRARFSWFSEFERRYPYPPGYAMDVTALDYGRSGLRLEVYGQFDVALPLGGDAYLRYVLSETNVELAISSGTPPLDIAAWCRATLEPIFEAGPRDVIFGAYTASVNCAPSRK